MASLISCFGTDSEIVDCSKETRTSATSFEHLCHYNQECQAEESQVPVGKTKVRVAGTTSFPHGDMDRMNILTRIPSMLIRYFVFIVFTTKLMSKCITSRLSCKAMHNNELVQEMHGNIVMNCNIFTNLLDKTQRHVIMPLFRKAPGNIYKIFRPKPKRKQNFLKPPENFICITRFSVLLLN